MFVIMIRDLIRSITAYFDAIPAISRYRLWGYVIFSAILSMVIGYALYKVAGGLGNTVSDMLLSRWEWGSGNSVVEFISDLLSKGIFLFVFWFMYKYIMFVILAPIMSLISEKIESIHDGTESAPFSISGAISDMLRGLRIAIRNIVRELLLTLLIVILGLFPALTLFSGIGLYLVQSYYAGFGNMDYYLERRMNVRETVDFVRRRKLAAVGSGLGYMLLLLIPVAGIILAPLLGAISATLFLLEESDV